tara:strand:- start:1360 stop:1770 length:411 start_codon:yes stop_codon:yes gene_type:complete
MVFDFKKYYQLNKEKIKQQNKDWVKNNKEYKNQRTREYCEKNKDILKTKYNEKLRSTELHKTITIKRWIKMGLKLFGYTYDEVYEYYLSIDNCEVCNKDISMGGHYKHLDHCHDTGIFRWVLCPMCNTNDTWMNII